MNRQRQGQIRRLGRGGNEGGSIEGIDIIIKEDGFDLIEAVRHQHQEIERLFYTISLKAIILNYAYLSLQFSWLQHWQLVCIMISYRQPSHINSGTDIAIALSVKGLGSELHILFGITLAGGAIFLGHSLYRFHRNRRRRIRREARRHRKEKAAEHAGFTPDVPIRVHMVQDEEIGVEEVVEKSPVKLPPPAYGIWRESVVCITYLRHQDITNKHKESQSGIAFLAPRSSTALFESSCAYSASSTGSCGQ
jgi:hypothetical protein